MIFSTAADIHINMQHVIQWLVFYSPGVCASKLSTSGAVTHHDETVMSEVCCLH